MRRESAGYGRLLRNELNVEGGRRENSGGVDQRRHCSTDSGSTGRIDT